MQVAEAWAGAFRAMVIPPQGLQVAPGAVRVPPAFSPGSPVAVGKSWTCQASLFYFIF